MVWQLNSRVIVMTTREVERGKNKCAKYWPDVDEVKQAGKITIKGIVESPTVDYTLREFEVTKENEVIFHLTENDLFKKNIYSDL
ncbi:tyrosine-protein phosphatase corkscrew-like [Centruroides sculpturatus]|uniref:tyrosine-protein phosphatase corkscrew-like n=1 Tax=Centruroides sculpturatus TaxID=218467 RepID=UPI000C6D6DC9|nr:tyrosine-protein phosphatase corkscrew-like [Centruroides sculpturatus]